MKTLNTKKHTLLPVTYTLHLNSGFTLIELLITIAIIGILSGLFVTTYPASQRRARDTQRRNDIKQYQTAMEAYASRNFGNYPITGGVIPVTDGTFCSDMGLDPCPGPNDPTGLQDYQVAAISTEYTIWARLEQPPAPAAANYFVVCSTGRSGVTTSQPTNNDCPTLGWQ